MIGAGIRNTTNATMLEAGYKHNVIPGEAVAYVDGRYLPGHADTFHADGPARSSATASRSSPTSPTRRWSTRSRATSSTR